MKENKKETVKKTTEVRVLIIAVVAPIAIALIVAGVPVIWSGLVTVLKTVVPSIWVGLAYLYIAFIFFLVGRITRK